MKALQHKASKVLAAITIAVLSSPALARVPSAGGSGLPWEAPLDTILTSLSGPVSRTLILISVIACGIGLAFGSESSGFRKIMGIAFGAAITIGAVSFLQTLFGMPI